MYVNDTPTPDEFLANAQAQDATALANTVKFVNDAMNRNYSLIARGESLPVYRSTEEGHLARAEFERCAVQAAQVIRDQGWIVDVKQEVMGMRRETISVLYVSLTESTV